MQCNINLWNSPLQDVYGHKYELKVEHLWRLNESSCSNAVYLWTEAVALASKPIFVPLSDDEILHFHSDSAEVF